VNNIVNKYFIYCNRNSFVLNFLRNNNVPFDFLNEFSKITEGRKPLLYNKEPCNYFVITKASLFIDIKDKLSYQYPFSKFLAQISYKNIHNSRQVLNFFNPDFKKEIKIYTTMLPAEKYNVGNKFSLDLFSTESFKPFKNLDQLKEFLDL
jgi:hypothetical protein